jgi:hypothetical protein
MKYRRTSGFALLTPYMDASRIWTPPVLQEKKRRQEVVRLHPYIRPLSDAVQ